MLHAERMDHAAREYEQSIANSRPAMYSFQIAIPLPDALFMQGGWVRRADPNILSLCLFRNHSELLLAEFAAMPSPFLPQMTAMVGSVLSSRLLSADEVIRLFCKEITLPILSEDDCLYR
jgi:hypothetical protein